MMFEAGRLAAHMMQLTTFTAFGSIPGAETALFSACEDGKRKFITELVEWASAYCDEVPFPMTALPLRRILDRLHEADFTVGDLGEMLRNAAERLRDEAGTLKLFRIQLDRVKYYETQQPFGLDVANNFPSVSFDALEACRCFALYRSTACVFHLMRVLEIGLHAFADRFGVASDRTNWHNIIEGIEKAVRNLGIDPTTRPPDWKDQQEFFSQAASHFMIFKDAWRNYTAHERGKFTEDEAETILINVRSFMQKLATQLHE